MNPTKRWLMAAIGLIIAAALGFGSRRWLGPAPENSSCHYSHAANLALEINVGADIREKIRKLDSAFGEEFGRACGQLCSDREKLSEKLPVAKAGDPDTGAALEAIHRQQAHMERMTWNHLIAVRDLLPQDRRAEYVRKVRADWECDQARLRNASAMGACRMKPGKARAEE